MGTAGLAVLHAVVFLQAGHVVKGVGSSMNRMVEITAWIYNVFHVKIKLDSDHGGCLDDKPELDHPGLPYA